MVVSAADGEREHSQEWLCHTTKDRFEERVSFFRARPGKTGRDADTALTARQDARNLRQRSGIPRGRQKLARTEQSCASAQFCTNSWLRPIRLYSEPPQSGFQPSLAGTI